MSVRHVRVPADLDGASIPAFVAALSSAQADAAVTTIVVEGGGGVFCRGMRLPAPDALLDVDGTKAGLVTFASALTTLRFSSTPTVAWVDGQVLGGGVGIAAACDVVLATERSSFSLSEVLLGLAPAAIFPLLLERLPSQKARRMALSARAHDAREACALGLVDEVIAEAEGAAALGRWDRLLARGERGAVAAIKGLGANADGEPSLRAAIASGAGLTAAMLARPEVHSRLRAFESGELPWERS
jgi:enoyl-CoA hydratase/carnithine racemase